MLHGSTNRGHPQITKKSPWERDVRTADDREEPEGASVDELSTSSSSSSFSLSSNPGGASPPTASALTPSGAMPGAPPSSAT